MVISSSLPDGPALKNLFTPDKDTGKAIHPDGKDDFVLILFFFRNTPHLRYIYS